MEYSVNENDVLEVELLRDQQTKLNLINTKFSNYIVYKYMDNIILELQNNNTTQFILYKKENHATFTVIEYSGQATPSKDGNGQTEVNNLLVIHQSDLYSHSNIIREVFFPTFSIKEHIKINNNKFPSLLGDDYFTEPSITPPTKMEGLKVELLDFLNSDVYHKLLDDKIFNSIDNKYDDVKYYSFLSMTEYNNFILSLKNILDKHDIKKDILNIKNRQVNNNHKTTTITHHLKGNLGIHLYCFIGMWD